MHGAARMGLCHPEILPGGACGRHGLSFFARLAPSADPLLPDGRHHAGEGGDLSEASNVITVGGSWMAPKKLIEAKDWAGIEKLAAEAAGLKASSWNRPPRHDVLRPTPSSPFSTSTYLRDCNRRGREQLAVIEQRRDGDRCGDAGIGAGEEEQRGDGIIEPADAGVDGTHGLRQHHGGLFAHDLALGRFRGRGLQAAQHGEGIGHLAQRIGEGEEAHRQHQREQGEIEREEFARHGLVDEVEAAREQDRRC